MKQEYTQAFNRGVQDSTVFLRTRGDTNVHLDSDELCFCLRPCPIGDNACHEVSVGDEDPESVA
eukprot:1155620-Pelagomonas_calceolata.AAC.6